MAKSDGMGDIITLGLVAVGGYLLWNWFTSQSAATTAAAATATPAATPAATTITTPTVATTPVTTAPVTTTPVTTGVPTSVPTPVPPAPSLSQLLQTLAGAGVATLDADQWGYYYAQLPGRTAIPASTFGNLFFPNGRPSDPSTYPMYTAQGFANILQGAGLSGVGPRGTRFIPVPRMYLTR